ncbi:MAG: methyltransferase domain-containing protein [Planctomycetia bacterium]|nr:methyltransferase domain-containing protein [Planctomycetia bacterium]
MSEPNPFDDVAYTTRPYSESHPDHLELLAYLHGLEPPPAGRCRVLEVGCGSGDNLAPVALAHPESHCVGIDLSATAIARARDMARACGLSNLEFRQQDLLEADADLGPFDYIIAHGFYSWVPAAVREKLLERCQAWLSPQGVAFISYAVFPGAHQRQMVREVLLHHAGDVPAGRPRFERAKELLTFLLETAPANRSTYRQYLEDEAKLLARSGNNYLHDNLSLVNEPVYFHQFLDHARRHGLQFLTDVALIPPLEAGYPAAAVERLRQLSGGERLALEQYRDFLEGRMFRESLLCRAEAKPDPAPRLERVRKLWVQSSARPTAAVDLRSTAADQFRLANGATMESTHPLAKAALCVLGERWPEALPFNELLALARARRGADVENVEQDALDLAKFLMVVDAVRFARLLRRPPHWLRQVSARPSTTALVRWQATTALPITNVWRQSMPLDDPLLRYLLGLLDGTRDRPTLAQALTEHALAHRLVLVNGQPLDEAAQVHDLMTRSLEANLQRFAQLCLLVG